MTDLSFLKSYRLLTRGDFQGLRPESRRVFYGRLVFFFVPRPNQAQTRIGISVSKKIGNAVKRNKIKRLIRESFRKSEFKNNSLDVLVSISTKNFNKNNNKDFLNLKESISNDLIIGLGKVVKRL